MVHDAGLLVRGGDVVDGSGGPRVRADVRVRSGAVVEVGPQLAPDGERELDATDAIVAPGFIDTHAHVDPQVYADAIAFAEGLDKEAVPCPDTPGFLVNRVLVPMLNDAVRKAARATTAGATRASRSGSSPTSAAV